MILPRFKTSYLEIYRQGKLAERMEAALELLRVCSVCPRLCGTNRFEEDTGFCRAGRRARVSSYSPHFGEEAPLVGRHGSGTIFLAHCNLGCVFCQNSSISHHGEGRETTAERLAQMMLELQGCGCHNINFVSPSHYVPQILEALIPAIAGGLSIPLVYNTGGYDSTETLRLLDGVVDIYMPDLKYSRKEIAANYSQAEDYPETAREAVREMHRQVGDLVCDEAGIALRGLLVRHLVLPADLAGTSEVMSFLAEEISRATYVNVMDQYYPCGDIPVESPLARRITREEFEGALDAAAEAGITRLDKKESLPFRFL